jgi:hypothetical protein
MAITVGDAVFNFLADTSQLDQAVTKVQSDTATKLRPSTADVEALSKAWGIAGKSAADASTQVNAAGTSMKNASSSAKKMGEDAAAAAKLTGKEMREAKGEVALLGDEIGLKVPRHLRSFIAELPGVGAALSAAFSITAVILLVDILTELPEKIRSITDKLAGWTEEQKAIYEWLVKSNREILDFNDQLEIGKVRLNERGLEGVRLTEQELKDNKEILEILNKRIVQEGTRAAEAQKALRGTHEETIQIENGMGNVATKQIEVANATNLSKEETKKWNEQLEDASDKVEKLKQQVTQISQIATPGLNKDLAKQAKQQAQDLTQAQISAARDADLAVISLFEERTRILYEKGKTSAAEEIAELKRSADARYDVQKTALTREITLYEQNPTKNAEKLAELNGKLEALEAQHQQEIAKLDQDGYRKNAELGAQALATQITQTTAGTQKRIDAEHALSEFYRVTWGANSQQYQQQLNKELEAQNAFNEKAKLLARQLANEQLKFDEATAKQKLQALDQLYEYLYASGKIGEQELLKLKQDELDQEYEIEKAAIERRIQELDPAQIVEAKRLNDELILLAQKRADARVQIDREIVKADQSVIISGQKMQEIDKRWYDFWHSKAPSVKQVMHDLGEIGKEAFLDLVDAVGASAAAAELASDTFGHAMQKMVAQILAAISEECIIKSLKELAEGFAALANPFTAWQAPAHFKAAAMYGAVAAAAGVAAHFANPSDEGGQTTAGAPAGTQPIETQGAASQPDAVPVQTTNVQHFARGGLVSGPTLAIFGETTGAVNAALSGPGQREAAIPLDDDRATGAIADAIASKIPPPIVHNHIHGRSIGHLIDDVNYEVEKKGKKLVSSVTRSVKRKS